MDMGLGLGLGTGWGNAKPAGGPSYDPSSVALFARMSVQPDTTRKGIIDTLVKALKSAGAWDNLDMLYVMAAHDAQAARLNWVGTAAGQGGDLSAVNSPIFTTDRGYAGDGLSAYLDTGVLMNSLTKTQQNSCFWSFGNRVEVAVSNNQWFFGNAASGTVVGFNANAAGSAGFRVTCITSVSRTLASRIGRFSGVRLDSSNCEAFSGGVSLGTFAQTSAAPNAGNVNLLRTTGNNSTAELSYFLMGASVSSAVIAAVDTALAQYLTAVGA